MAAAWMPPIETEVQRFMRMWVTTQRQCVCGRTLLINAHGETCSECADHMTAQEFCDALLAGVLK